MSNYRNLSLARVTNTVLCFASLASEDQVSQGDLIKTRRREMAIVNEMVPVDPATVCRPHTGL